MENKEVTSGNVAVASENSALTPAELAELEALSKQESTVYIGAGSGKAQAVQAMELFQKHNGTITTAMLLAINAKYPSDPVYFARTLLGAKVQTLRARGGKTTYKLLMTKQEQSRLAILKAKAAAFAKQSTPAGNTPAGK